MSAGNRRIFILGRTLLRPIFYFNNHRGIQHMQLTLIKNTDELQSVAYKIARTVYAETHAVSLRVVEALTSMIYNSAVATHRCVVDVALDADLFPVLNRVCAWHAECCMACCRIVAMARRVFTMMD